MGFNRYLQPELRVERELISVSANVKYNPSKLMARMETETTSEVSMLSGLQTTPLSSATKTVGICK
jgi:hypothetical protein